VRLQNQKQEEVNLKRNKMDFDLLTREFLHKLQEGKFNEVGVREYIQALGETLNSFSPRTQTEQRRLSVAKQHLKEIKRHTRRLQEKVAVLEEQMAVLEEQKEK
jgi:DNA-binding transcriptional MerR regulator